MERFAPIRCRRCGAIIGVIHGATFEAAKKIIWIRPSKCLGRNAHARPDEYVEERCFRLVHRRETYYPETRTGWTEYVYRGPRIRFLVFIAMCFGVSRERGSPLKIIRIDNKVFAWDGDIFSLDACTRTWALFSKLFPSPH